MPTISTPSKIAATQGYGAHVYFSGSTSEEREAVVADVMKETGAVLVPPYDHPDIILGQGTMALELEAQVREMVEKDASLSVHTCSPNGDASGDRDMISKNSKAGKLDAVIAPIGGGGMLSGIATALAGTGTLVFGAEPSFEGADDARRSLASKVRVTKVSSLTIADGLRTPVGEIPWAVVSDIAKVRGVYAVSEGQILQAMRLVLERMKVVVEPSAVVGLAVCLFDEGFRGLVEREGGGGWDVGVVLSGGNVGVEALGGLFGGEIGEKEGEGDGKGEKGREREMGKVGARGGRVAEGVAG